MSVFQVICRVLVGSLSVVFIILALIDFVGRPGQLTYGQDNWTAVIVCLVYFACAIIAVLPPFETTRRE